MNDTPHLLAIVESKMAQLRTNLEHDSVDKARDLLAEIAIYTEGLRTAL